MSEETLYGNYRLLRRLARGGMAEVFLAQQMGPNSFERTVAVKRILPHLAGVPEFVEMFMQEARLAARLSHPNVAHIYEFGQVKDSYFIAMEHVDGVDLSSVIVGPERPLPMEHGARIMADACAALHYAHQLTDAKGTRLGIVHRDVSPQNILVSYTGAVKLVDFGIAKAAYHMTRTQPGVIRGKYTHMSPEQVEGRTLDGRSDVFCAGIVLFELSTGEALFPRTDAIQAMRQIRSGKVRTPQCLGQPLPKKLEAIIRRALARNPKDRFATAAEMQLELEDFVREAPRQSNSVLLGEYFREHYPPRPSMDLGEDLHDDEALGQSAAVGGKRNAADYSAGAVVPIPSRSVVVAERSTKNPSERTGAGSGALQGRRPLIRSELVERALGPGLGRESSWVGDASEPISSSGMQMSLPAAELSLPPDRAIGLDDSGDGLTPILTRRPSPEHFEDSGAVSVVDPVADTLAAMDANEALDADTLEMQWHADRGREHDPDDEPTGEAGAPTSASLAGVQRANAPPEDLEGPEILILPDERTSPPGQHLRRPAWPERHRRLTIAGVLVLLALAGGAAGYWAAGPSTGTRQAGGETAGWGSSADEVYVPVTTAPRPGAERLDEPSPAEEAQHQGLPSGTARNPPKAAAVEAPPTDRPPAPGTLELSSAPPDARVLLSGRTLGRTPLEQPLPAGKHTLILEHEGYARHRERIELRPDEVVARHVRLRPSSRARPSEIDRQKRRGVVRRPRQPRGGRHKGQRPTTRTPKRRVGYISVMTIPWSRVYLGKRRLGETPLAKIPLPAGRHKLRLVNPDAGVKETWVVVRPNQTTKVRLRL